MVLLGKWNWIHCFPEWQHFPSSVFPGFLVYVLHRSNEDFLQCSVFLFLKLLRNANITELMYKLVFRVLKNTKRKITMFGGQLGTSVGKLTLCSHFPHQNPGPKAFAGVATYCNRQPQGQGRRWRENWLSGIAGKGCRTINQWQKIIKSNYLGWDGLS